MIRIYRTIEFAADRGLANIVAEKLFDDFDQCCQHALINGRRISWSKICEYVTPQILFDRSWDPGTDPFPQNFYVDSMGKYYEDAG